MKKNIFDTSLSTTIKLSLRRTLVLQQSLQQLLQQPAQSEAKGSVIVFIFYFTQRCQDIKAQSFLATLLLCVFA